MSAVIAEREFVFCGIISGTARCVNTKRSLTHLLDASERGLAVKATQDQIALLAIGKKLCSGPCAAVRPLDDFYTGKRGVGGRRSRCKDCMSLAGRERYMADPEAARAAGREVARRLREANPGRARQLVDEYQARNRKEVFDHYGYSCACCGTIEDIAIDHVNGGGKQHREELGGATAVLYAWLVRNLFPAGFQTLCRRCNSSKAGGERCRIDHEAEAMAGPRQIRLCVICEQPIDPIDRCAECAAWDRTCTSHRRPLKRVDAMTCSKKCQNALRKANIACDIPEVPREP